MKLKVVLWSVTVALGGFLFGYDTAVISGAEQAIQKLWSLSDGLHGFAVAIALYGTVIGAMLGGIPADSLGRKKTLFWIGVLYFVSAIGSALAPDIYTFMVFRFIGGLGVGASSVVAPLYISEISPANQRGRLVAIFQFNIVLGILIAFLCNYLIQLGAEETPWRLMMGVEGIPALLFVLLVMFVPRSPRWLIVKRGLHDEAKKVLALINSDTVDESYNAILKSAEQDNVSEIKSSLFSKKYSVPLLLAFLIAFFNQWSGINAIIYYAPRIFELTGLGADSALLSTSGVGLINLIFTMIGMTLIDKMGRKKLMFIGSIGLIATLALVSNAFFTESFALVPIYLFVYIAFFAMSQGAVIWVFISEVFPNKVRASGQSFGCFIHWIFAAIIANIFPFIVNKFSGGPLFAFFSFMMVLQLIFVWRMMPETKGKSLEQLEDTISHG
ncbi:sugar porter family MFS transporter [Reichenbachiella sp. MALMAid0571]|uniref:sugar porter family MFS transporter n=1 Tax=Reichenbachiella sp. MALMAid0571 TaxID=3143939 RepID=UPI0032DE8C11